MYVSDIMPVLLAMNKINQERLADIKKGMPLTSWLDEIATIHLNLGRRTGKTEYISNNASDKDLVILPRGGMKHMYSSLLDLRTIEDMNIVGKFPVSPEVLWIDEPRMCGFTNLINTRMLALRLDELKLIIKLGE